MGLRSKLLLQTIFPLVLLLLVFFITSFQSFLVTINNEVSVELENFAYLIEERMNTKYPGDYYDHDGQKNTIYKGTQILNDQFDEFDHLKGKCGIDVTLFFQEKRVITTINDENKKIVSTEAPEQVVEDVLNMEQPKFYSNVSVNKVQYYAYYKPLYNSDGKCIGMLFVGKPCWRVYKVLFHSMMPIFIVGLFGTVIIGFISSLFVGSIVRDVHVIKNIHSDISNGILNSSITENSINRKDEIGEIAKSVIYMQGALKDIIELDLLTGILNRRSGMYKLQETIRRYEHDNTPFNLALADVDFFKNVNDTYGHEAGDKVLKSVTDLIKRMVADRGYVVRWGGEEFLIVYENMSYEESAKELHLILEEMNRIMIELENGTKLKVTMTFGLVKGKNGSYEELLINADQLLYRGKENGRNQVVTI